MSKVSFSPEQRQVLDSYRKKEQLILNALSFDEGKTIEQVSEITNLPFPTIRRMLGSELNSYVEKQGSRPIYYTLKS